MDTPGPKFLYMQILEMLKIEASKYAPGEFIGTEVAFANKFSVSRPTVRKAVDQLIEEGTIERVAGVGLVVAQLSSVKQDDKKREKSILIIIDIVKEDIGLFSTLVMGAIDIANSLGYSYYIINQMDIEKRQQMLNKLDLRRYSGAVFKAFDNEYDKGVLNLFEKNDLPFILVDNPLDGDIYNYVVADDYTGGFLIGKHLAELGHKKILFISVQNKANTLKNRIAGFQDALKKAGIPFSNQDVVTLKDETYVEAYIKENASKPDFKYTAIASCHDVVAMYVINTLGSMGINVPEDISVTGFGDYISKSLTRKQLTTIKVSGYEMGSTATKLLLTTIIPKIRRQKVILDVELCVRESTGPAKSTT